MPPAAADGGAGARARAARLLATIVRDGRYADPLLADVEADAARDAALIRALVLTALRWHHRLEWQLTQLLSAPLAAREFELAALLRIGLAQLQWLRVPDHAAVAATVGAAPLLGRGRAKGLVNAVLRRFQREREALALRMHADPVAATSHPAWIIASLNADWPERAAAIMAANNERAPMCLRVNARRRERDAYIAELAAAGIPAAPWPASDVAVVLAEPRAQTALPGYADGIVSVQDGAAQLAAGFLDVAPGMRVLDACAAPGGKTAHVLERCPDVGRLVAVDRDADRLATMRRELDRLGLHAEIVHADAADTAAWWDGRPFDRILLDAPCSALGVLRRHPDIKLLRTPRDVDRVTELQARLLESLWPLLAPGGRLLYTTCTVLKRENAGRLAAFAAATPDARPSGPGPGSALQRFPGETGMDGFYYACIDKQASRAAEPTCMSQANQVRPAR